jgi:hypothetical protein
MDNNALLVPLFHISFVFSILFYIGIKREALTPKVYPWIAGLGAFVILYHAYKISIKKNAWVNYFHLFIVGPLLLYVGIMRDKTERKWFEFILMLAFASLGYHGYYLLLTLTESSGKK